MRIQQMTATNSSLYLNKATDKMQKSAQRLASGKRILTAADDASGLARVQKLRAQLNTLNVSNDNLNDAKALTNVKDGALEQITELAQKINELYADGGDNADTIEAYAGEIESIIGSTTYNEINVFQDSYTVEGMDLGGGVASLTAADNFKDAATAKAALDTIVGERAKLGAYQNSMDARISINSTTASNLESAISLIEDVDIDRETIEYNKQYILQQTAQAMIANQNNSMYSILNLFG